MALLGLLAMPPCAESCRPSRAHQGRVAWILPALALIVLLRIRAEKPAA